MTEIPFEIKKIARRAKAEGYVNIFDDDMLPETKRLYGTESLCGDWNAETIILGQDFASAKWLKEREKTEPDFYSHSPKFPTNILLAEILDENGIKISLGKVDEKISRNCGIFYMNACFLLRDGSKNTGNLKNKKQAMEASRPVFDRTLEHLKNAKRIICMGKDAYEFAQARFGFQPDWRDKLGKEPEFADGYHIFASVHLGHFGRQQRLPKGSKNNVEVIKGDWRKALNY